MKYFILVLSGLIVLSSCDQKKSVNLDEVLANYPKSAVGKSSGFEISFKNKLGTPGQKADEIIELSPSARFEATWVTSSSIRVNTLEPLKQGGSYKVKILGSKIKDSKFSTVKFDLQVRAQNLELEFGDPSFAANGTDLELSGQIVLSDELEGEMADTISAKQESKALDVKWLTSESKRSFKFLISGINRETESTQVKVNWDFSSIGLPGRKDSREFTIEPYNGFEVEKIVYKKRGDKNFTIIFNDPLKKKQNLKGLIRVGKRKLRFVIEQNKVNTFFVKQAPENFIVRVEKGVQSLRGDKVTEAFEKEITTVAELPGIRFLGSGAVLPDSKNLSIPFEAASIHSVQVTAFEIYENNIPQFLQSNSWTGSSQLEKVGRYLWRKTIPLETEGIGYGTWKKYHLNLDDLIASGPKNMYRIELSINRSNSSYECSDSSDEVKKEKPFSNYNDSTQSESSGWDGIGYYYSYGGDSWTNRSNPCKDAYYIGGYKNDKVTASKNILRSNLGLMVQRDELGDHYVITTNILEGSVEGGVLVEFFNYQGQKLGEVKTDGSGLGKVNFSEIAFFAQGRKGEDQVFLKINKGSSLAISHFDVGGGRSKKGLQGKIFQERGVWRPGDLMHATLVIHDPNQTLPKDHPVSFELRDPKGRVVQTTEPQKSVYPMHYTNFQTDEQWGTGTYTITATIGDIKFSKSVSVESVKPNRLKVLLSFSKKILSVGSNRGTLFSEWLHGAKASDLAFSIVATVKKMKPNFTTFTDYKFTDDTSSFSQENIDIAADDLDEGGNYEGEFEIPSFTSPGSMLNARFETRVYEPSGNYSVEYSSMPLHPYSTYVGLKAPKGDAARNMLLTDIDHELKIATVDQNGKPISDVPVDVTFHKIRWRWWWQKDPESLANITGASGSKEISRGKALSAKGLATYKFKVKYPDWGRYMLRACLKDNGHCSSKIVYVDWPGWAGRAGDEKGPGATRLNLSAEKSKLKVGEKALIYLPKTKKGRALVTISRGDKMISQEWIELSGKEEKYDFKITPEMNPNIYVAVTLIQPMKDRKSDRPIRLYGIIPISIENPETELNPQIAAPDQVKPKEDFEVVVKEKSGKPMTFSLAVVDEGLLGLTKYRTPNLRAQFYQRQAYGLKTWDLFDEVIGGFAGKLERLLAVGGDAPGNEKEENKKKRRFDPVVKVYGPFHLKSKDKQKIKVSLPNYVGSVRAMVVSAFDGKYGFQEKEIKVKDKLMILPSIPRVLSPGDKFRAPVTIFALDDSVKKVSLSTKAIKGVSLADSSKSQTNFSSPGEKLSFSDITVMDQAGSKASIKFSAKGGGTTSEQQIYADIRMPNPAESRNELIEIEPGKDHEFDFETFGITGTNELTLEGSHVPPLNLAEHLDYLIGFPHGCAEQTVSKAFPQLVLNKLLKLNKKQSEESKNHVLAALERLASMQMPGGMVPYWPGVMPATGWLNAYVAHFVITAQKLGYFMPAGFYDEMLESLSSKANRWTSGDSYSQEAQAYRLYALAFGGKPNLSAMSRLKEQELNNLSKWLLGLAFYQVGMSDAASNLISKASFKFNDYIDDRRNYGSQLRDLGISLLMASKVKSKDAKIIFEKVQKSLVNSRRLNTHGIAFALIGLSEYFGAFESKGASFKYKIGKQKGSLDGSSPFQSFNSDLEKGAHSLKITNTSDKKIYVSRILSGSPEPGKEQDLQTNKKGNLSLSLKLKTKGMSDRMEQEFDLGEDYIATVTIRNESNKALENVALNFPIPSGFEIFNSKFDGNYSSKDYQDVRDDRILNYFNLSAGQVRVFKFLLHSSYQGKFYFPATRVESMYDKMKFAQVKGRWIEVN